MNPTSERNVSVQSLPERSIWDDFLSRTQPHTFLHDWCWGEFYTSMGYKIFRIGIFQNGQLHGVALIIKIQSRRGTFLFCPHGPLLNFEIPEHFSEFFHYVRDLGKKEKASFIRLSPLLKKSQNSVAFFQTSGFRDAPMHMHVELAWILDITPPEDDLLKNMRKSTRYAIKKAQKYGVTIFSLSDLSGIEMFYNVYKDTAKRQKFVPFSYEYIRKEFEAFASSKRATFFFARFRGEILATAMILFSSHSAFYHHGASFPSKIPAPHLLQFEVIREAKRRGMSQYNFWGIAPEDEPKHPFSGITVFKKGFSGFEEAYVHAQDFVLGPKYWLNYLIETARKYKRGFS